MKNLKLVKVESEYADSSVYRVEDNKDRVLGFVQSVKNPYVSPTSGQVKNKNVKFWGFALVETEFRSGIQHPYRTRTNAVEALVKMRAVKADTSSITIIK